MENPNILGEGDFTQEERDERIETRNKAAGITAPVWLSGMAGWGVVRSAGIGAISDTISHTTDGENALGMMRDRFGWMDTPLSTRDTDHPLMMKFKNIVEGMGIGILFDSAAMALGRGGSYAKSQVAARNKSVELQTIRKGIQDTASSIQTFPERVVDTLSGEVQREKKEKDLYRPE